MKNEPAFPILGQKHTFSPELNGMSKHFYAACHVKDDFDKLELGLQEEIIGEKVPRSKSFYNNSTPEIDIWSLEYAQWLAKGRAKWRFMQAQAMIEEEELLDNI